MPSEPSDPREALPSPLAVWATMAKEVREYDQDNVKRGKGDVDTLLVFAGLFSAVLASFLVAVYPNLQPSPMDMMNYTLERIANQTASYNFTDGRLIATNPSSPPPPFRASPEDIRVNVLWFASLIISLITSSFGMLVKQWMDDFLAVDIPEPQARLRLRHHRAPQIDAWMVYEIVACLPLLLHLSLGLFFIGLCYFTSAIHASVGHTTLPLVVGWTLCLFVSAALPIFFPHCPYKISLFKPTVARIHRAVSHLARPTKNSTARNAREARVSRLLHFYSSAMGFVHRAFGRLRRRRSRHSPDDWFWPDVYTRIAQKLHAHLVTAYSICVTTLRLCLSKVNSTTGFTVALERYSTRAYNTVILALQNIPDEQKVLRDSFTDLEIFASIDAMRANDEILTAIVAEELPWIRPSMTDAVSFVLEILAHRVPTVAESECLIPEWPFRDPFPLDLIRAQAKENITKILHNYVICNRTSYRWNSTPIAGTQRHKLLVQSLSKARCMILCTITMIISDVANSPDVQLPPNIIDFLRYYLDGRDGPAVCRDILSLTIWHCADATSRWTTAARVITALTKLTVPLNLTWRDKIRCFKSILCLKVAYPHNRLDSSLSLVWNYPEGFGSWEEWNVPYDTPDTLYGAILGYLFVVISSEFTRVEALGGLTQNYLQDESVKVLSCALRQLMRHAIGLEREDARISLQAFVDLMALRNKDLMDVVIDAFVSTDLADLGIKGTGPYSRWSNGACHAILNTHTKPSNAATDESFRILSSLITEKLADPDTNLTQSLSLCHITAFLYLSLYTRPDDPSLGNELFSSIATFLTQRSDELSTEELVNETTTTLAYGCLYIIDIEDPRCTPEYYHEWRADFLQATGMRTSFPDSLVEVLGRFIPEGKDEMLFRLREYKDRTRFEVQRPEEEEAIVRAVIDASKGMVEQRERKETEGCAGELADGESGER